MRVVVNEAHTPAQCPTFGKVSTPQGAVTLNAVCSYWLQRAHYDAVILVKYTTGQTASLCHNFCVPGTNHHKIIAGSGLQGWKLFGKATFLQWEDIVRKSLGPAGDRRWFSLSCDTTVELTSQLDSPNSQLNFNASYRDQAPALDLVVGELRIVIER